MCLQLQCCAPNHEQTGSVALNPCLAKQADRCPMTELYNEKTPRSAFRQTDKKYKLFKFKKAPKTDFTDVIDFRDIACNTPANRELIVPITLKLDKTKVHTAAS